MRRQRREVSAPRAHLKPAAFYPDVDLMVPTVRVRPPWPERNKVVGRGLCQDVLDLGFGQIGIEHGPAARVVGENPQRALLEVVFRQRRRDRPQGLTRRGGGSGGGSGRRGGGG